jgi:hypothetical protein
VQEVLGRRDVSTTIIYTHVLNKPGLADSEAFNRKLRKVLTFVLGSVLALVAVFAVCTGHVGIGRVYHRDISVAENPGPFWLLVLFYVALAVLCFCDLRRRRDNT